MIGDGQTDTRTHFLSTFLECGSDVESKIIKKSKSKCFTIAILPSLLMSLESKNDKIIRLRQATEKALAGRIGPAGRSLDDPVVYRRTKNLSV